MQVVSQNSAISGPKDFFFTHALQKVLSGIPDPGHCKQDLILYLY